MENCQTKSNTSIKIVCNQCKCKAFCLCDDLDESINEIYVPHKWEICIEKDSGSQYLSFLCENCKS